MGNRTVSPWSAELPKKRSIFCSTLRNHSSNINRRSLSALQRKLFRWSRTVQGSPTITSHDVKIISLWIKTPFVFTWGTEGPVRVQKSHAVHNKSGTRSRKHLPLVLRICHLPVSNSTGCGREESENFHEICVSFFHYFVNFNYWAITLRFTSLFRWTVA